MTPSIQQSIEHKCRDDKRLTFDEGLWLIRNMDLFGIGRLAEERSVTRYGSQVFYRLNRHIHYTNLCENQCAFCGFSRRPGQEGAFLLSIEQIAVKVAQACSEGVLEVHIVGGVHSECDWPYYLNMIRAIRKVSSTVRIKAFTATEIIHMADQAGKSVAYVLEALMEAGLNCLPGGGAEILDEGYFKHVCPKKPGPAKWLDVHATAHELGLMTNATMLFGYRESPEQIVRHLICLRSLQDQSIRQGRGRFECFVPLPYVQPTNDELQNPDISSSPDAASELKIIALSRLMFDNVDRIKAFWPMLGEGQAQMALCFGANDLDGTVGRYGITPAASDQTKQGLSEQRILQLVGEIGKTAQRDH